MARSMHEKLGERLRIKLVRTWNVPGKPGLSGYSFEFPALMIKGRSRGRHTSKRCYPGAQFYGTTFGSRDWDLAWKRAIQQYARSLEPVFTLSGEVVPTVEEVARG